SQLRRPALPSPFPYRRSSDLALQQANGGFLTLQVRDVLANPLSWEALKRALKSGEARIENIGEQLGLMPTATLFRARFSASHERDRKSTRLNSSHVALSYAVY